MTGTYYAEYNGEEYRIEFLAEGETLINGQPVVYDFQALGLPDSFSLLVEGTSYDTSIRSGPEGWEVVLRGRTYIFQIEDERQRHLRLAAGSSNQQSKAITLRAPMPGLVIEIPVQPGDQVHEGDVLLVLESMKMQNELTAPRAGIVSRIEAEVNSNVERNQTLLSLE